MGRLEYFAARTADSAERERLAALEASFDPQTQMRLRQLGVDKGWRCLEVGAGAGSIARWLAETVGDDGHVTAADIDTRFLDDIGSSNVDVRQFDILKESLSPSNYDLVHCRFLLIHLADPAVALRRMINAVKVDGWIVIEEFDFSSLQAANFTSPSGEFFTMKIREVFQQVGKSGIFDPYLGRRSIDLLEQAGLSDVQSEGTVYLRRGGEAEALLHHRSLPTLSQAGACSQGTCRKLQAVLEDPEFRFTGATVFSAWGRRSL